MHRWAIYAGSLLLWLTLFAAVEVLRPHDGRTALLLFDSRGQTASGEKFGVAIGMHWGDADHAVRRLFSPKSVHCVGGGRAQLNWGNGGGCKSPPPIGVAQITYTDSSWRNGSITLRLYDGRVREILWSYHGPFYIDL